MANDKSLLAQLIMDAFLAALGIMDRATPRDIISDIYPEVRASWDELIPNVTNNININISLLKKALTDKELREALREAIPVILETIALTYKELGPHIGILTTEIWKTIEEVNEKSIIGFSAALTNTVRTIIVSVLPFSCIWIIVFTITDVFNTILTAYVTPSIKLTGEIASNVIVAAKNSEPIIQQHLPKIQEAVDKITLGVTSGVPPMDKTSVAAATGAVAAQATQAVTQAVAAQAAVATGGAPNKKKRYSSAKNKRFIDKTYKRIRRSMIRFTRRTLK